MDADRSLFLDDWPLWIGFAVLLADISISAAFPSPQDVMSA